MERGDIVYHDELIFIDNTKDNKKKRPCVVLFSETKEDGEYICSIPLTSKVKTFNKHPNNYVFIPQTVYDYKTLSFARLDGAVFNKIDNVHDTGLKINQETIKCILEKIDKIKVESRKRKKYKHIKKVLKYIDLFDKLEKMDKISNKRQEKNKKRRSAKQNDQKVLTK